VWTSSPAKKLAPWVGSPGWPNEPAASLGCQAAAGSARASERVTCVEPPRGKKKSAETTSPRAAGAWAPRSGWWFHPESPAPCTVRFSSVSLDAAARARLPPLGSRAQPESVSPALGLPRADPFVGLLITLVILKITWDSWRMIHATEPGEPLVHD
jgi:hypothetical protein